MIFRKRNIFNFLFLVYFLLYVISPICYAEDGLNEKFIIAHETKQDTKNLRVIWELILSKLLRKDYSENNDSGVQLIIKKARAVLSSNNITKTAQAEFEVADNAATPYAVSSDVLSPLADPKPQNGSYLSFSGLSPPVV